MDKNFDCNKCKHKQQNALHCLFYQHEPTFDFCASFQQDFNKEYIFKIIEENIIKKAIALVNDFQDFNYSIKQWIDFVQLSLTKSGVDILDTQRTIVFIREIGGNGLLFSCDNCKNSVELIDDSSTHCPYCKKTDLNLTF